MYVSYIYRVCIVKSLWKEGGIGREEVEMEEAGKRDDKFYGEIAQIFVSKHSERKGKEGK